MKKKVMSLFFVVSSFLCFSQSNDTIRVDASKVNTSVLITGTHRYLVYFRMSKNAARTMTQFWTRTIEKTVENGKQVLVIKQEWEDKDTIVHNTTSVCDALTMQPLSHKSWWKGRGTTEVNFTANVFMFNGTAVTAADTLKNLKTMYKAFQSAQGRYSLNWNLDLEVFPALLYRKGVTFLIPFYDPGISTPLMEVAYTVTGSAVLSGYDNRKVDCWLLTHESKGNKEVFWISKKTKEVLKLEQEFGKESARYKIKLPFSN
ncbi:hypothetical protein [Lacibacter sp.]|uniref:hypothetical protein n=1 Tax=Lacibacter sp. TaxID=1915409 RepID=UPI002B4B0C15|nr:hypothetical protein [Lacibacter sp.]HLP38974.1 hypothetical protein [Lacibacter sp.]